MLIPILWTVVCFLLLAWVITLGIFEDRLARLRTTIATEAADAFIRGEQVGRLSLMVDVKSPPRPAPFQERAARSLDEYLSLARARSQPLDPETDELVSTLSEYHIANSSPAAVRARNDARTRAFIAERGVTSLPTLRPVVEPPANELVPAIRAEIALIPTPKVLHKRRTKVKSKSKK